MDGLLVQLYRGALACAPGVADERVVLGAVGGYGRELLGCKSDLDVCFVTTGATERARSRSSSACSIRCGTRA